MGGGPKESSSWKERDYVICETCTRAHTPEPPPIDITDVTNISPRIQLLEQIAKQQYEIKALADNQVKIQPKTSQSYRTSTEALAEK
jgi:hypothetical protein